MILVTTESVPGKKTVKTLGLVRGNTIRARHLGHDFMAFLKNIESAAEFLAYGTAVVVQE